MDWVNFGHNKVMQNKIFYSYSTIEMQKLHVKAPFGLVVERVILMPLT